MRGLTGGWYETITEHRGSDRASLHTAVVRLPSAIFQQLVAYSIVNNTCLWLLVGRGASSVCQAVVEHGMTSLT